MPIFDRYGIERYKEILVNQPAGLVTDGGFSTYSLDDPSVNPDGTGDFLGVIKTVILLAEVYKESIDTRNLSFSQFNSLTQQEFDNYISQGIILKNRFTNGQSERIGWVEIGRSHSSFYYQSCSEGKRPISEHYYDIQEFRFSNVIVSGEGSEIEPTDALTPIGSFDPNIENNLGIIRPRFDPLNLTNYIRFAMRGLISNNDGEVDRIGLLSLTDQTIPMQVSLLMANRSEHFDNQFATEISPGKWGMVRRTISESLRPGVHMIYPRISLTSQQTPYTLDFSINQGQCLQTTFVTPTTNVTTTSQTGGPFVTPTDVVVLNDVRNNTISTMKNPTDNELEVFKQNLLKKIRQIGFIYNENVRTYGDSTTFGAIQPDFKKYPEMIQMVQCNRIQLDNMIREIKINDAMEKLYEASFLPSEKEDRTSSDDTKQKLGLLP